MTSNDQSVARVVLLVATADDIALAHSVCTLLESKFPMIHVSVRSTEVPLDRLASTSVGAVGGSITAPRVLFVLLKSHISTSFNRSSLLDPVLELNVNAVSQASNLCLEIAKFCSLVSDSIRAALEEFSKERRQAQLVNDAQLHTKSPLYASAIERCYDKSLQITGDQVGVFRDQRKVGKVRDRYEGRDRLALVTTDRQSGFDRQLASVPFKGAVLNLTSAYWFEATKDIIPNHLVAIPHPNVSIVKKCKPFPIEFVVRSYMTGSTSTSIWKNYQDGVRSYCGHQLPDGMKKNEKLARNLLTPTTKEEEHDRPISAQEVVAESWMTQEDFDVCGKAALEVFALGQRIAAEHGLILVDTKYEFGRDIETGDILLIDEVHTPDSSRYWIASTYQERILAGKEPENIDKEFLRLWFRDHCDPYKDEVLPEAPKDLVCELARRYISLYEMITWNEFVFDDRGETAIGDALTRYL